MTKKVHPDRWVWTVGVDDLIEQATEGLYASGCVEGDADFESNLEAEVCDAANYEWECLYEAIQAWMDKRGIVTTQEHAMAKDALWWAAMTYVVAAISSLATLLYYVQLFMGGNRRD